MLKEKTGCPKLDSLLEKPCDLKFTFEILSIEEAGSYEKEGWSMTPEERLNNVPRLKEEGNKVSNFYFVSAVLFNYLIVQQALY